MSDVSFREGSEATLFDIIEQDDRSYMKNLQGVTTLGAG